MIKLLIAIAFLGADLYVYQWMAKGAHYPERKSFESFPLTIDEWQCADLLEMGDDVEKNLGVTDYLLCSYFNTETRERVEIYVGYHASQVREEGGGAGENSIHPPAHCLPGSGWDIIANKSVELDLPGLPEGGATAKRLIIAKGDLRQLVYYWYQSRGRVISEDWQKILYVGWDRATRNRTDGALVRFTIQIVRGDEETAERAFRSLAPRLIENLPPYVPA